MGIAQGISTRIRKDVFFKKKNGGVHDEGCRREQNQKTLLGGKKRKEEEFASRRRTVLHIIRRKNIRICIAFNNIAANLQHTQQRSGGQTVCKGEFVCAQEAQIPRESQ